MPSITDWLMVGITTIYVIATIVICIANYKSSKASRDQIALSKEQYEDSKRLSCMPFLQLINTQDEQPEAVFDVSLCNDDCDDTIFLFSKLRNVGNGTARNINFSWKCNDTNVFMTDYFPSNAIPVDGDIVFQLNIDIDTSAYMEMHPVIELQYDDLLGNTYFQKVYLTFNNYDDLHTVTFDNDIPEFKGILKYRLAK